MITYVRGDATQPIGTGNKIIAHIVNDVGAWGAGFVLALSARWPHVREDYLDWKKRKLGDTMFSYAEPQLYVAHLCAQRGVRGTRPLNYEALVSCLKKLCVQINEQPWTVHMPRIGCGLGGGSWDVVGGLVERWLDGVEVFVYDLPEEKT